MAIEVKLPELGEGVTEGELVKWLVKPGDTVKPDQPVAEVMTDKATVEVPTPVGGVVETLLFKVGEIIPVEKIILHLKAAAGAAAGASTVATPVGTTPIPTAAANTPTHAPKAHTPAAAMTGTMSGAMSAASFFPPVADSKVLATPATRRLAREFGIDINQIKGTGLAGRVTRDDVTARSGSGAQGSSYGAGMDIISNGHSAKTSMGSIPRPGFSSNRQNEEERVAIRGIRKKIAENMQMAKHIIPHFTLMDEAVVTELVKLRDSLKEFAEKNQTKITYLPIVMKAMIATAREFPMFNASIDDAAQEIVYKKYFNMGFAADTPNGLVVPVIKDADQKSILELSREILDLSKRARDGKLKPEEMKGATMTITNIGSVGGTYATPIINHPEVVILGMYKIQDRLVLDESSGKVSNIKVMNFTVTADHRLIDGAVAANFLKNFIARIQQPGRLMMEMA